MNSVKASAVRLAALSDCILVAVLCRGNHVCKGGLEVVMFISWWLQGKASANLEQWSMMTRMHVVRETNYQMIVLDQFNKVSTLKVFRMELHSTWFVTNLVTSVTVNDILIETFAETRTLDSISCWYIWDSRSCKGHFGHTETFDSEGTCYTVTRGRSSLKDILIWSSFSFMFPRISHCPMIPPLPTF